MIDRKWIGHEFAPAQVELERGRLRFFAQAIGETNPVYTDVDAARSAGHSDLPCPPTFLFVAELDSDATRRMLDLMAIPIAKVLHGEQSFTYHRIACAGETITVKSKITDIFDKNSAALEFVVKSSEARDAKDELVAELRSVIIVRS